MARGGDCSHCDCPFDRFIFGGRFGFSDAGVVWHFHMTLPTVLRPRGHLTRSFAVAILVLKFSIVSEILRRIAKKKAAPRRLFFA